MNSISAHGLEPFFTFHVTCSKLLTAETPKSAIVLTPETQVGKIFAKILPPFYFHLNEVDH
jgi:hypothetical protein